MSSTSSVLRSLLLQFQNPANVVGLLLVVGVDVIQRAIAQLCGFTPLQRGNIRRVSITPVAFSFGWVAFAYSTLVSVAGAEPIMPTTPDCPSILVDCDSGYCQPNRSWVLGRILRDHESRHKVRPEGRPVRIQIFDVFPRRPALDTVWYVSVLTIFVQIFGLALPAWVLWHDRSVMLVTVSGTILALITGSLPQWLVEKWPGQMIPLKADNSGEESDGPGPLTGRPRVKTIALTRGNGHQHIMILRTGPGSYDIESLASGAVHNFGETRYVVMLLVILWTCLLLALPALTDHPWMFLGIGLLGLLQNTYAAGATRKADAFGFSLNPVAGGVVESKMGIRHALRELAQKGTDFEAASVNMMPIFLPNDSASSSVVFRSNFDKENESESDESVKRVDNRDFA